MPDVTVPTVPALATIPDVELVQTGQWDISTGRITVTTGDLAAAVGALDCPAVRRPVIVLGHNDPRFSGEPAVGWIGNMALANSGHTIVGDYVGMPSWLAEVLASAYPDRSFEGFFDFKCQLGHTHPFVITAMALLGVTAPGIGTLQSLQDVAGLYGVAAAAEPGPVRGEPVTITLRASKEPVMPNPRPVQVAAAVSSEDVRRQYYETAGWSIWICEMQLDPLQIITVDDDSGQYARVPIVLDGDTVTFGEAVPVRIEYVDMPAPAGDGSTPAAASAGRIVFASRAESRPGLAPGQTKATNRTGGPEPVLTEEQWRQAAASQTSPAAPAVEDAKKEGAAMIDAAKLREALGLSPEASDEEVRQALTDQGVSPATEPEGDPEPEPTLEGEGAPAEQPVSASQLPAGTVAIDETTLAELRAAAEDGRAARRQQLTEARDAAISAAIGQGKIPPARRAHWETSWAADPDGTKATLASLAPGLVPIADVGVPGGDAPSSDADASRFDSMFSTPAKEA